MGLATAAINCLRLPLDEAGNLLVGTPIARAVTYIFGAVGSTIILAQIGPKLLSVDLVARARLMSDNLVWESLAIVTRNDMRSDCAPIPCRGAGLDRPADQRTV